VTLAYHSETNDDFPGAQNQYEVRAQAGAKPRSELPVSDPLSPPANGSFRETSHAEFLAIAWWRLSRHQFEVEMSVLEV